MLGKGFDNPGGGASSWPDPSDGFSPSPEPDSPPLPASSPDPDYPPSLPDVGSEPPEPAPDSPEIRIVCDFLVSQRPL